MEKTNWNTDGNSHVFVIDSIKYDKDGKQGKARLIGNITAVDLMLYPTGEGITFIEESPSGNLMILTVFAYCNPGTNNYVCVYSRHINSLVFDSKVGPFPSQYHGVCKILN